MWWYGNVASVPEGFVLCDGTQGTPDLRDKFVIPAKQDDAGVAKATINGALAQSGGTPAHTHGLRDGLVIIDSAPVGDFLAATGANYHYPPCKVLCLIMQI